jgi:hypothetical protein
VSLPRRFVLEISGQLAPPPSLVCPPGQAPALIGGQWSCREPLVDTHPILAVLLVAGFIVLFLGTLLLTVIFPA